MNYFLKLKSVIQTQTFRQSSLTSTATLLNSFLGLIFYILVARFLGPASFGVFSIAILTISLISDISNVGTDTGVIRFVGKYISQDKNKALKFLKLGLETKIIVGILVGFIGWLIIPWVANNVLQKPELVLALRLSLIGAFGSLIFSFVTSSIQSLQKFLIWGVLNVSMNFLRLVLLLVLFFFGILNLNNALISYLIFPFLGFLTGIFFLPKFLFVKNEFKVAKEFFHYNKWVAIFTLIAAFSSRLDTYLVARFLNLSQVGIYSVAINLASFVPQIVFAIATVAAPKLAGFNSKEKAVSYLKKLQLLTLGLAFVGVAAGSLLGSVFIPLFYGVEFRASVLPFIILIIAQAFFLVSIPAHSAVIYYFSYPKLFVGISLVHLAIILILGWFLISQFGYVGASITVLIGSISNLTIPGLWVLKKLRK